MGAVDRVGWSIVKVREMGSMLKEGVSRIVKAVMRECVSELMRAVQLKY